jgi:hypothetical protein
MQLMFIPGFFDVGEDMSFIDSVDNIFYIRITGQEDTHGVWQGVLYFIKEFNPCRYGHFLVGNDDVYINALQQLFAFLGRIGGINFITSAETGFKSIEVMNFIVNVQNPDTVLFHPFWFCPQVQLSG